MINLDWSFQDRTIDEIRTALVAGFKKIMVMAPTGSGKTHIAVKIINMAIKKGKKVLFVVDRKTLVNQTSKTFWNHDIDHGIVQGDNPAYAPWKGIQICSIQSLMRRRTPDADLVIVDEAHTHYAHMTEIMDKWNLVPFIGLSATPFTRGLGNHYKKLIISTTVSKLIESGNLVKPIVFDVELILTKKVPLVAGEFSNKVMGAQANKPKITADIVTNWIDNGEGRKTILFPCNVAHSKALCNEFNEHGIITEHVDAHTTDEDREAIFERFKNGETTILSSVGVLTKGFDETSVSCIILARGTKSLMLYIQMVGRGARAHDGKSDYFIFDHATNVERLGWPDDPLPDTLCNGDSTENKRQEEHEEKKEKELKPKKCPECSILVHEKDFTCHRCGHLFTKAPGIDVGDGKLVKKDRSSPAAKRNREISVSEKQAFYSAALEHCKNKGFKEGWAANAYRDRFSVWPNSMEKKAGGTCLEFENHLKHKRIAYAKRRQA